MTEPRTATEPADPLFYKPEEAAAVLRVSLKTLYKMVKDGHVAAVRTGGGPNASIRIPKRALDEMTGEQA